MQAKLTVDQEDIDSALNQFMVMVDDNSWPEFAERFEAEVAKAKLETISAEQAKKFRKVHRQSFKDDSWYQNPKYFKNPEPGDLEASIVIEVDGQGYVLDGQHRLNRAIQNGTPIDVAIVAGDWVKDYGITKERLNNKFNAQALLRALAKVLR
jgi:hypothetical protein